MDQVAVAQHGRTTSPADPNPSSSKVSSSKVAPKSKADEAMCRILRIPGDEPPIDESETHRIFSASMFLSALRCLLTYVVLPLVLPAVGIAKGVGPAIAIPVGILALVFDYLGIRRFWLAAHRQRWMFSAIYAVVGAMVLALLIVDVVDLVA